MKTLLISLLVFLTLSACAERIQQAARDTAYSAYEFVGVEKRDLLKRRIAGAGEKQKDASESFQDALQVLQATYGEQGTDTEKIYKKLSGSYEESAERAEDVKESSEKMNTVAQDLFREWEKELGEIKTADLKARSRTSLRETRTRFSALHEALLQSERKMSPVLSKLKDHTLFLKHNVNAQSVASLKTESQRIESDIQALTADMNKAIQEAEAFVETMK
jgi:hypothetical protein